MALQLIDTGERFTIISAFDASIGEGSDLDAYKDTLDEDHLVLDGEPTRFVLRPMGPRDERRVHTRCWGDPDVKGLAPDDDARGPGFAVEAFVLCCEEVRGVNARGEKASLAPSEDWLRDRVPFETQVELGTAVILRSKQVSEPERREEDLGK